jgi:hypothetical protein
MLMLMLMLRQRQMSLPESVLISVCRLVYIHV